MAYKNVNKNKMKKQIVPELKWITRKRVRFAGDANVSVRLSGKGKAKDPEKSQSAKVLTFIFRDNLHNQFKSDYIMFAVLKNRLYFKGTTSGMGYKITMKATSGYMSATLQKNEIAEFEDFALQQDFSLKYDDFMDMYYIELAKNDNTDEDIDDEAIDEDWLLYNAADNSEEEI